MTTAPDLRGPCAPNATRCVTCSDEAVPMRVVSMPDTDAGDPTAAALCEDPEGRRVTVLVGLVDRARPGDRLLVHAGAALRRLAEGAAS